MRFPSHTLLSMGRIRALGAPGNRTYGMDQLCQVYLFS